MNDVDSHHAFKMAKYDAFIVSLNHLALSYVWYKCIHVLTTLSVHLISVTLLSVGM